MTRRAAIGALVLCGCLSVPAGPDTMCDTAKDCLAGEACVAGVCYGNPPAAAFAAVVSPPSTRYDLVRREIAALAVPNDGQIGPVVLSSPVLLNGTVTEYCTTPPCDAIGAIILVTRKPQFSGGPGFKAAGNVDSRLGFSVPVPPVATPDDPYVVTVIPDAGHQVPPLRLTEYPSGTSMQLTLGGAGLPVISGTLTDSTGQGLAGYRVAALGQWDADESATEVSSAMITDATGAYAITLSANLFGTVELVATAPTPSPDMPDVPLGATIHVANLPATTGSSRNVIAASTLGNELDFAIHVVGLDDQGAVSDVVGATVTVSATTGAATSFTVSGIAVTGQDGLASFRVLDGPDLRKAYKLSIVPPPNASLGTVYGQPLTLPASGADPMMVQLGNRFTIQGQVVDASGAPVAGASVTAKPALRFLWAIDPAAQTFVGTIPAAVKATDSAGGFAVEVDAKIGDGWGSYDLVIESPSSSDAPTVIQSVNVPRDAQVDTTPLGTISLPAPARVHGQIVTTNGDPIENAELKLFYVQTQQDLCTEYPYTPEMCTIPATLLGRNTSDATGAFRVALPSSIPTSQ